MKPAPLLLSLLTALSFPACDGDNGAPTTPAPAPAPARATETFTYSFTLRQNGYTISGPTFTTRDGGAIDVTASFQPVSPLQFGIDLLYRGGNSPHNEGPGGPGALGPGPTLVGHWDVGFIGEFQARIWPANALVPLPVPPQGVTVPVVFTVNHP